MPPAAALPESSMVGICQNGAKALRTPATARISARKESTGCAARTPIMHQAGGGRQRREAAMIAAFEMAVGMAAHQDL